MISVALWRLAVIWPWLGVLAGITALTILATVVALLRYIPTVWPTETCCSGGAVFEHWLGLPVALMAAVIYATFATICATTRGEHALPAIGAWLGWGAIGGSLYFLWLSLQIDLVCTHCLALHGLLLALIGPMIVASGSMRRLALLIIALAALVIHAGYNPGPRHDPGPAVEGLVAGDLRFAMAIDRGRRRGALDAPLVLDVVVNIHCKHCAREIPPLVASLDNAIAAGKVELVYRLIHESEAPGQARLTPLAYASAADDKFADFITTFLGFRDDLTPAEVDAALPSRFAELTDLAEVYADVIALTAAADRDYLRMRRLKALGPQVLLRPRGGGDTIGLWRDRIVVREVVDAINAATPGFGP